MNKKIKGKVFISYGQNEEAEIKEKANEISNCYKEKSNEFEICIGTEEQSLQWFKEVRREYLDGRIAPECHSFLISIYTPSLIRFTRFGKGVKTSFTGSDDFDPARVVFTLELPDSIIEVPWSRAAKFLTDGLDNVKCLGIKNFCSYPWAQERLKSN